MILWNGMRRLRPEAHLPDIGGRGGDAARFRKSGGDVYHQPWKNRGYIDFGTDTLTGLLDQTKLTGRMIIAPGDVIVARRG